VDHLTDLSGSQPPDRSLQQGRSGTFPGGAAGEGCGHLDGVLPHAVEPAIYTGVWDGKPASSALASELTTEHKLRKSQTELRELSRELLTIQDKERQRIAADLHDGIGQSLSLVKLSLDLTMQQIKTGRNDEALESLKELSHKVKETLAELRRTTMDLRPSMLDDLGLVPTLSWFLREFETAWHDRTLEKDIAIAESDVPEQLKGTIFRILQEATCNIVKHANADWVRIGLKRSEGLLRLSIEDNGRGFDGVAVSQRRGADHGFGLVTMKERARSSDGVFELKSAPQQGTQIIISWRIVDIVLGSDDVPPATRE
jgi:signal transduction histidine kinase